MSPYQNSLMSSMISPPMPLSTKPALNLQQSEETESAEHVR